MTIGELLAMDMKDLSYVECFLCENYFFVHEFPMGLNDPNYCPYCGCQFEYGGDYLETDDEDE